MTPRALQAALAKLVAERIDESVMIWGPPGVGKSSVVRAVAATHELELVDVRISQLAPTDLRGLPVPDGAVSRWLPPEFLPRAGAGILFLDEINLAAPAVQAIAQQLILDRCVGSYRLPEGWFVWAAGNRREDRAAVFEMPAPLANRFLHFHVEPDLDSFLAHAAAHDFAELIVAFLAFRPLLLHRVDPSSPAWPSPRSWEMASRLWRAGASIEPAVGSAVAAEVQAFEQVFHSLPDLDAILAGRGGALAFPREPSARYAITIALAQRVPNATAGVAAFAWLAGRADAEWPRLFAGQVMARMRQKKLEAKFVQAAVKNPALVRFLEEYRALVGDFRAG